MKLLGRILILANFALLQVVSAQVPASSDAQADIQSSSAGINVHEKNKNGFTYACGGVGSDESAYMKKIAKNYDLMSTFARRDGSFLADINIAIKEKSDKSGHVILQFACGGPMMLVKFPHPGTYQIQAEVGDSTVTETVQIPPKSRPSSKVFEWPAS